ncbi:nucleotide exchange factor GrpE [Longitalea luteola]|uniref:nucleotide exchange factor GrpE n=1 Tax=Longitalea luteola TaxID=2812563 RepID=UPI001A974295|nr:nucleotide exchange factor GrpE [Longitalea luteola]
MAENEKNTVNRENGTNSEMDVNTDESISGSSQPNEPVASEEAVEKLKAEITELKDKYLRQVAEFENFKRRTAKERIEMIQTAGKEVVTSLLEVLDDCDRAEKQLQASDNQPLKEGIQLVFNKLRTTLQSKGVKPMLTIGTDFNPDQHEAITEIPAPSEELKGKVVDEVQKGYYMNEKIIRFAKVVVGK